MPFLEPRDPERGPVRTAAYRQVSAHRWEGEVTWDAYDRGSGWWVARVDRSARTEARLRRKLQKVVDRVQAREARAARTERAL